MTREEFLEQFGARTAAYLSGIALDPRPVVVVVGEDAHTPSGHLLVSSLVNLLARAHRAICLIGDLDRPLLAPTPFGHATLAQASAGLAREINPFIQLVGEDRDLDPLIRIAIGGTGPDALVVGCAGWCARFDDGHVDDGPAPCPGAALAACLAASAAFAAMCGRPFELRPSYSLWEGGAAGAAQGPDPEELRLGKVLQVGAGAVGAALDFWLFSLGATDFEDWLIVDGDFVDATNLNRQMLYRALDAGFPDGPPPAKALRTGELIGAQASDRMWGRDRALVEADYDLVLALADEDGVRSALQHRQPPLLLHATTGANWQAQVHRHIRGRDDCILCRLPGGPAKTICATAEVEPESGASAALPFLSAAAGLLLTAGLFRLSRGVLAEADVNSKALHFGGEEPRFQDAIFACRAGCRTWLPAQIRRKVAAGTLFAELDYG